jgi:3-hydroxymyristoyl/3-hydroxydecanoyl-(acyl carrier protein) dehydratase
VALLLSIDKARLRRPVVPGDQLILEAETRRLKAHAGRVDCRGLVNGKVAVEAQLNFMLVDQERATNQPESELA